MKRMAMALLAVSMVGGCVKHKTEKKQTYEVLDRDIILPDDTELDDLPEAGDTGGEDK